MNIVGMGAFTDYRWTHLDDSDNVSIEDMNLFSRGVGYVFSTHQRVYVIAHNLVRRIE